jgi:hypothetical protein
MAKVGRKPRSVDSSARTITVRLTEQEHARLTKESAEAKVGISQLIRSRALETPDAVNERYRQLKEAVALVLAKF